MSRRARFYAWMEANPITVALTALVIGLIAATVAGLTLADEQRRLEGVESAGPCRANGPSDPECQRQARLIVQACVAQPVCREVLRLALKAQEVEVSGSSGDSPSSQPSPGAPGPRGPRGPQGTSPPATTPQPESPATPAPQRGPVTGAVCDLTGVCTDL